MQWDIQYTVTEGTSVRAERLETPDHVRTKIDEARKKQREAVDLRTKARVTRQAADDAAAKVAEAEAERAEEEASEAGFQCITSHILPESSDKVICVAVKRVPPTRILQGYLDYDGIAHAFYRSQKESKLVVFLGAGASFAVRPDSKHWEKDSSFPPSAEELARYLIGQAPYFGNEPEDWTNLAQVASWCVQELEGGPMGLRATLREVFWNDTYDAPVAAGQPLPQPPAFPQSIHHLLARIKRPMLIITTNYDMLLERAFRLAGRTDYDIVVPSTAKDSAASVNIWRNGFSSEKPETVALGDTNFNPSERTVIFKMHGSVTPNSDTDSFIITEEHYVRYLGTLGKRGGITLPIPNGLSTHLAQKRILFLGYSLRDWNLRVILDKLKLADASRRQQEDDQEEDDRGPHIAIQYYPNFTEQKIWEGRGVKIRHARLQEFVGSLTTAIDAHYPNRLG